MIRDKANKFNQLINAASTIAIVGHIRPDGDCIGSALGLYNYILDNKKNVKVDVYLEAFPQAFMMLKGADKIRQRITTKGYDLCISVDCAEIERQGKYSELFKNAITTVCIDHHSTNKGFGDFCYIVPDCSSACETILDIIDIEKVSLSAAECFYAGIVNDTGVFKYNCCTSKTMELAGILLDKGVDAEKIIDGTFFQKTYTNSIMMAKAILCAERYMDNRVIASYLTSDDFKEAGARRLDADGIVEQLQLIEGIDITVYSYPIGAKKQKYSLRSSKEKYDVSQIAAIFGGGGHVMAAGFETTKSKEETYKIIFERITELFAEE